MKRKKMASLGLINESVIKLEEFDKYSQWIERKYKLLQKENLDGSKIFRNQICIGRKVIPLEYDS